MKKIHVINKNTEKHDYLFNPMFRLRHSVFKEKLNWKVNSEDQLEIDEYDDEKNANYVVVTDKIDDVVGCMRLLPTIGRYMLKDTFSDLAHHFNLPQEENVWEISRFAVNNKTQESHSTVGFGETTNHLAQGMCDFAIKNNISHYIGLTTPHVERLIKNLGLTCTRMGQMQIIDDLKVVAIEIKMDAQGIESVRRKLIEKYTHLSKNIENIAVEY